MGRLSKDAARIAEIAEILDRLDGGDEPAIRRVLPEVRSLIEVESLVVYSPIEVTSGWELERLELAMPDEAAFRARALQFFATAPPRRFGAYDVTRPELAQRNRLIDSLELMTPEEYEPSRIYREVIAPSGLHRHRQPRILICDGPALLAWFGSFHPVPLDARQQALMTALAPALQRRLQIERQLGGAVTTPAILAAALEQLAAPAFVIAPRGRILETNSTGRLLLDTRRSEVLAALDDARLDRPGAMKIQLIPIVEPGIGACWLAIVRSAAADQRGADAVARVAARWRLTPRQCEVLARLIDGDTTAAIAAHLGISERAVELHLTKLFDHAGVDGRAALVAKVLLGD